MPNDLMMGPVREGAPAPAAVLLTGPNMGGKSTLLRAACLAVLLAQCGAMAPCADAELSPVRRPGVCRPQLPAESAESAA